MRYSILGKALALTGGIAVIGLSTVQAATLAALQDGNTIAWIDTDKKKVTGRAKLQGGARVVGIDVRPSDKQLYGVTTDGAIVTIDPKSGMWQKKSQLSEALPRGADITVDFNPAADRMRILTSSGMSLRVNVDDGKAVVDGSLKYGEGDVNKSKPLKVVAGAYSNSFAGTKETALYDIDAAAGVFLKQAPPNDGIVTTIGALGVKLAGPVAFDILADGKGGNVGWMLANKTLYSVDIATGKAKALAAISGLSGKVTDMAILP